MNRFKLILVIVFAILLLNSCKKSENKQIEVTFELLHGNWVHNYNYQQQSFMPPPEYEHLQFGMDEEFLMIYRWRTDLLTNECHKSSGIWYVKGAYKLENGKLYLNGNFTDENFNVLVSGSGCDSVGKFVDTFEVTMYESDKDKLHLYWTSPKLIYNSFRNIELDRVN